MPFTPTHIAAVLPVSFVAGRRLPFSALVIGSQIPDLPMYLPGFWYFNERILHTPEGLAAGCLPLGLLAFVWFQGFAKEPLVDLLPLPVRQRIQPVCRPLLVPTYSFLVSVLVAIAIGAATHLFWDSFTHYNNWGYRLIPRMNRVVFASAGYSLELYKALQYGSTVVFLPLIALESLWWLTQRPVQPVSPSRLHPVQRNYWIAALLCLPPLAAVAWSASLHGAASFRAFAVESVTTMGMLQFLLASVYAGYYWTLAGTESPTPGHG